MSDLVTRLGTLREDRQRQLGAPSNFVAYTERDGGPWYAIWRPLPAVLAHHPL